MAEHPIGAGCVSLQVEAPPVDPIARPDIVQEKIGIRKESFTTEGAADLLPS
ncbi:MAG: hypothetical protein U0V70_17585 [Terriglobia bacterium]